MYINIFSYLVRNDTAVIVLRLIWEFRWYKQKVNRRTEILFLLLTLLAIYPYMFQSDSFELEQFTTHDCFKKVSVQFFSTVTNWKGGTLDKSLFILELGKITVQVHPPTYNCISFLFSVIGSLMGCRETTLVLICIHWHKSRS